MLSRTACLPVILEAAVEMATSQGDDCVGPPNRPEHTGLFEARTDDGLAARFNDAGANKEVLTAELGVTHALGISRKIVCLGTNRFDIFGVGWNDGAEREHQFFDFPLVEQPVLVDLH